MDDFEFRLLVSRVNNRLDALKQASDKLGSDTRFGSLMLFVYLTVIALVVA